MDEKLESPFEYIPLFQPFPPMEKGVVSKKYYKT